MRVQTYDPSKMSMRPKTFQDILDDLKEGRIDKALAKEQALLIESNTTKVELLGDAWENLLVELFCSETEMEEIVKFYDDITYIQSIAAMGVAIRQNPLVQIWVDVGLSETFLRILRPIVSRSMNIVLQSIREAHGDKIDWKDIEKNVLGFSVRNAMLTPIDWESTLVMARACERLVDRFHLPPSSNPLADLFR